MIAIDWGTSQLRAYRLDADGGVIESREKPEGILSVAPGGFPAALAAITAGWDEVGPIVLSGMVGSRQGWVEVPYVACPAGIAEIAAGAREVPLGDGRVALICPGLACRDKNGVPDVLRGEEVQVFGALALRAEAGTGSILMAGTHCKHIRIEGAAIRDFTTHMTGEVFALLKRHSILGRMMVEGPGNDAAFAEGVARARQEGGLLHHLFGVRARGLFGEIAETAAADYLSGILVGHNILAAAPKSPVLVIGAPNVAARYVAACAMLGLDARMLASEAVTIAGLRAVTAMRA